jgi:Domain of unknown function (DUF4123)/Inner membrane component of T3SS, cytoplasmic domain
MNYFIEIVAGPNAGTKYPLGETTLTIGRNSFAGIACPEDSFLSGMHCSIQLALDGVHLKDLGSTNGTFVNGQRICEVQPRPGELIKAGSLTMRVVAVLDEPVVNAPTTSAKTDAILDRFAALTAPLYCLLDAACDRTIPSLLALAQEQKQCLYDGQSAVELGDWAPYLVKLETDAPFTKALLDLGWGNGWASYFTSQAAFEDIRHHFRKFLMVQVQGGEELYFRFYDPRVLRDFLPTANPSEAVIFFGPVSQWLVESEDPAIILGLQLDRGVLAMDRIALG